MKISIANRNFFFCTGIVIFLNQMFVIYIIMVSSQGALSICFYQIANIRPMHCVMIENSDSDERVRGMRPYVMFRCEKTVYVER